MRSGSVKFLRLLAFAMALAFPSLAWAACSTGVTTCTTDTTLELAVANAINDAQFQTRVRYLWVTQCEGVYNESAATVGHANRVTFCYSINRGLVPATFLASSIITATVAGEILAGSAPGGNAVDVDLITGIGIALTVTNTGGTLYGIPMAAWPQ
jgi:hypothetical protein